MGKPNWENRTLFQNDNLEVLRHFNSESVGLIATDPPFNKNKDFHSAPDSLSSGSSFKDRWRWEEDVQPEWADQIEDDFPAVWAAIGTARQTSGDDMGAFLCFMSVRLLEMHRILRKDGTIYLHCDHTASHYLRMLLDAIWGRKNFLNEIVWFYDDTPGDRNSKWFPKKHDVILGYAKNKGKHYFDGTKIRVPIKEASKRRYEKPRTIGGKTYTGGTSSKEGKIPEDVWKIPAVKKNKNNKESTGYATQKPLALYERIINAATPPRGVVLDPFAGCATTCVAAEKLNRNWVGIDIWEGVHQTVIDRLRNEGILADPSGDSGGRLLTLGQIHHKTSPPTRTDGGATAAPFLSTPAKKTQQAHKDGDPRLTKDEMKQELINQNGMKCQGCDREFDHAAYLELDHQIPRTDGGWNSISNRVLLCGPCNRLKSNQLTLSGLRKRNEQLGRI